ncbi:hypothetical protein, partial [Vibrio profundi]|uniref:hypothetical protein n=1 Tax=Vibrio profundi TaxID=1774960 RepID=UPI003736D8D2
DRRTLVAAKVWVSPYPIGVLIIHTKHLRVIRNACRFRFAQSIGKRRSHLNAALAVQGELND